MIPKSFITSFLLSIFFLPFLVILSSAEIEQSCLNLICKTVSNCDTEAKRCLGSGNAYCGAFLISHSYWQDSGSPGGSFHSCSFNLTCSRVSVANYMNKYAADCDGDGVIDCADYAAIHKAGQLHCTDRWVWQSAFMQSFFSLSGRSAEASEPTRTRVAYPDPYSADLRDYRRVVTRRRPTPAARRGLSAAHDARDIIRGVASALGSPWLVDIGSRRSPNSGTGTANDIQPPRRRRIRPETRPTVHSTVVATTERTFRSTRPYSEAPHIHRRLRTTTLSPAAAPMSSTGGASGESGATSVTIPWWRLATTSPLPHSVNRRVSITTKAPSVVTRATTATTNPMSTVSRRVPNHTLPATAAPTRRAATGSTEVITAVRPAPPSRPSDRQTTTRKPGTKPTFNPTRMTSSLPSSNDVETPQDVAIKQNVTIREVPLSEACLECICFGSSGCNFDADFKCVGEEECGPYRIDYAYWYEAGYPGYKGADDDFVRCAKDRLCSGKAVRTYVRSSARDCNRDGVIDCLDYASIHKAGPDSCNTDWMYESKFWSGFSNCYGFDEKEMNQRRKR